MVHFWNKTDPFKYQSTGRNEKRWVIRIQANVSYSHLVNSAAPIWPKYVYQFIDQQNQRRHRFEAFVKLTNQILLHWW